MSQIQTVFVYPFPASSGSNHYLGLLYGALEGMTSGSWKATVRSIDLADISEQQKKFPQSKHVIHVHWSTVLYGSRWALKSAWLLWRNFRYLRKLKNQGVKILWTMHNFYAHDYPHPKIDRYGREQLGELADAIIIQQKKAATDCQQRWPQRKINYLPHGHYLEAYGPLVARSVKKREDWGFKGDDLVLISLGAIRPYKGLEEIVDAIRSTNNSNLKMLIAGQGQASYIQRLKSLVAGDSRFVFYDKFVADEKVPEFLSLADYGIFWYDDSVLTSGGIILSLSYGLSVIARSSGLTVELVREQNGHLFQAKDDLIKILDSLRPGLFNGQLVQQSVADWSWENISKSLLDIMISL